MDFELTSKQRMIQKTVREFAETVLKPTAAEIDETQEFSWENAKAIGNMGLWGIQIDPAYGGSGLDTISYAMIIEEIARVSPASSLDITVHNSVCAYPIQRWGTDDQKSRFLPRLASGEYIGGFSMTEPNAGSDVAGMQTTAVKDGDTYILNGTKTFVTNGGIGSTFLIGAQTNKKLGAKGIAVFILEKSMEGFTVGKIENKLGMRGSSTAELIMTDVVVPNENILGMEKDGFKIAMETLYAGRIGIAAQAIGIAQAAFELSVDYSSKRQQFGKPINSQQVISFYLADMLTEIDMSRLLVQKAAFLKDKHANYAKESAQCKLIASETAMRATTKAIQIFGGYGYIKDYPIERFFRDAKVTEIYEGTSEIMRMIIAQDIIKNLK
ncbi:MAG TPA: acyl-CoA dehydrogenase family protein [Candidatus Lokiarchaeia archaeon]|nr:acyl-CoA dehydrogenase family protein [Candidatus Lokiarchaeia archaeon]